MRRLSVLLTALLCCLSLCACTQGVDEASMAKPIHFYYPTSASEEPAEQEFSSGSLQYEVRDIGDGKLAAEDVLSLYFEGPRSESLYSPFPAGLTVESAEVAQGVLTVLFGDAVSQLSGVELTTAAACLVRTMTQLDGIEFVRLEAQQPLLSGLLSVPLAPEDFVLADDYMTSDNITVRLYFPVKNGKYLREETRSAALLSDDELPSFVLQQLTEGSKSASAESVISAKTSILGVSVLNGVCTVNFSDEFLKDVPTDGLSARLRLLSVVNSLTNLDGIDYVRILCDGAPVNAYGPLTLTELLQSEPGAVETEQPNLVQETSLYLPCGSEGKLAEIPVYVRKSAGRQMETDVLDMLFDRESKNGYVNVIPEETSVVELTMAYRTCRLTLSSSFADLDSDPEKMTQAVRSIVASLCELDSVDTVQLKIADREIKSVDLSRVLTPNSEWFLS